MTDTKDKAMTGLSEEALAEFIASWLPDAFAVRGSGEKATQHSILGWPNPFGEDEQLGFRKLARAIIDRLTASPPAPVQFLCPCCGARGEVNEGASTVCPPAPQAEGEIERAILAFFNAWPAFADWFRSLEDGYGNKLDVDDIPPEPFEAALRAAQDLALETEEIDPMCARVGHRWVQIGDTNKVECVRCGERAAPARTYADGIEDAAKVVQDFPAGNQYVPPTRKHLAEAIRALATKPAGEEP